jgi:hypothetical protein
VVKHDGRLHDSKSRFNAQAHRYKSLAHVHSQASVWRTRERAGLLKNSILRLARAPYGHGALKLGATDFVVVFGNKFFGHCGVSIRAKRWHFYDSVEPNTRNARTTASGVSVFVRRFAQMIEETRRYPQQLKYMKRPAFLDIKRAK